MAERNFFPPDGANPTAFNKTSDDMTMQDTIQGMAQRNARTWQIIALASMSSFFISLFLLAYALNLPKTVPVIVTVNPEGQAHYVGKIDRSMYNATIPEISKEYLIRQFIELMHSWVIDKSAQNRYVETTQSIVQGGAIHQLDTFYRSDNPYNHLGMETSSAKIETLLKQTDKTYICYFRVIKRHINGYELSNKRWSALINIDTFDSKIENPLGLYITNFDLKQIAEDK